MKTRLRFAFLPVLRFSSEFYQNGCYWLRFVRQRQTPSGWKALESDNR